MTTKTKNRQELFLDRNHPNYAELTLAGLSERDTCEFYLTNDGKAIAFNFDNIDEFMKYLGKLQGSRVECKLDASNVLGWKYTDSYCLDNRPDGEGWVKFDVLTYMDDLKSMLKDLTPDEFFDESFNLVNFAHSFKYSHDVYFRVVRYLIQMQEAERNLMSIDNALYMGIVFNLTDVKP